MFVDNSTSMMSISGDLDFGQAQAKADELKG